MEGATPERLAELVAAAPGPPMVTAQTSTGQSVPAALLAWGRTEAGWMAGIAFLGGAGQRRAIITMWAASSTIRPAQGADYRHVPRGRAGRPEIWPHTSHPATHTPKRNGPRRTYTWHAQRIDELSSSPPARAACTGAGEARCASSRWRPCLVKIKPRLDG